MMIQIMSSAEYQRRLKTGEAEEKSRGNKTGSNKYRANSVELDGILFASGIEAARYNTLCMLRDNGKITNLRTKTPECVFRMVVNGELVGKYTADFLYLENGVEIVEDVKSDATYTEAYGLRKKLMKACFGIDIREYPPKVKKPKAARKRAIK